jgi:putative hydrolase of HD superfamily
MEAILASMRFLRWCSGRGFHTPAARPEVFERNSPEWAISFFRIVPRMLIQPAPDILLHLATAENIARAALLFGEVPRATQHADGRAEMDTTHTVMLALCAYEFAPLAGIDPLEAMADAMVHDLPEPFSSLGDVNTAWGLSPGERLAKQAAESLAVARLAELLPDSQIVARLRLYERQATPAARFVRYLDKILPKLTHLINRGQALRAIGMSQADMIAKHREQGLELAAAYPDQPFARALFAAACEQCEAQLNLDAPICSSCHNPGRGYGYDGDLCLSCARDLADSDDGGQL